LKLQEARGRFRARLEGHEGMTGLRVPFSSPEAVAMRLLSLSYVA
jgi:hypothetical protein